MIMRNISGTAGTLAAVCCSALVVLFPAANAQDAFDGVGVRWPADDVAPLETQLVLEALVYISEAVEVGPSDQGQRQFIPITGGYFVGDGIRGSVVPGGADWQLVRSDGVLELTAIYSIRTHDDAVIIVENRGIGVPPGEDNPGEAFYLRSSPQFHAPAGPYEWLNKGVFVGSVTPHPDGGAVVIRVFRVL